MSKKQVAWNGVTYNSMTEAAKALGISNGAMSYRIRKGYVCDEDMPMHGSSVDDIEGEIWKSIVGFEGLYEVSNLGRVRSLKFNGVEGRVQVMKPLKHRNGYLMIHLTGEPSLREVIHRLVASAFIVEGEIPSGMAVNHLDGNRTNNEASNLEVCTYEQNTMHAVLSGKMGKLSPYDVRRIRQAHKHGASVKELAEKYDVTGANIRHILNRVSWKHVG